MHQTAGATNAFVRCPRMVACTHLREKTRRVGTVKRPVWARVSVRWGRREQSAYGLPEDVMSNAGVPIAA